MEINYRKIRKDDGYEWYTLLSKVWRTAYGSILPEEAFVEREKAVPAKAREFTLEKFSGDRKIAYVAEHGGKIVGLMYGTLDSDYGFFKDEYADLVALYVYPEYQGMGVGTALKGIFERWAREKNADKYVVGVLKDNARARKVYESWGGTLSSHEQDFVVKGVGYPESFYTFKL